MYRFLPRLENGSVSEEQSAGTPGIATFPVFCSRAFPGGGLHPPSELAGRVRLRRGTRIVGKRQQIRFRGPGSRELEKHSSERPDSAGARDDAGRDLERPQPGPSLGAALQGLRPALMHVNEVPAGLPF